MNIYCSSYCNKGHDVVSGKPIAHECRIIPPAALKAEIAGDIELALQIMAQRIPRYMRRGMRARNR